MAASNMMNFFLEKKTATLKSKYQCIIN